jgi:hypothetical protein
MSIELDAEVGRLAYGWTRDKTEQNPWYDPWAKSWRPLPLFGRAATPAFSRDSRDTMALIEHLHHTQGIVTSISYAGEYLVLMQSDENFANCRGTNMPELVCETYLRLKEDYEGIYQFSRDCEAKEIPMEIRKSVSV